MSLASFCPRCEVFFKARGASHEPKDVFVSEGVLHVGAMRVVFCRAGGNPCVYAELDARLRGHDNLGCALCADALRPFALYCLGLLDTAKGVGMAEATPIGFVLGTKPASSLEFYVLVDQHNYLEMDDVVFVR